MVQVAVTDLDTYFSATTKELTNKTISSFKSSETVTITAPSSSGTLALTSELHNPVTLANENYLGLSGQEITGGTVPVGSCGTNITSYNAGDILYATGATTLAKLAKGDNSRVLQLDSTGTLQYGTVTNDISNILKFMDAA